MSPNSLIPERVPQKVFSFCHKNTRLTVLTRFHSCPTLLMAVFDQASAVYSSDLMIMQRLQITVISLCSKKHTYIAQQSQGLHKFTKYQNQDRLCI